MATVHITLNRVAGPARANPIMPVIESVEIAADTMTSSASSAQSSAVATAEPDAYWQITASGGDVFVKFGSNPTAASDSGHLIIDGTTRDFAVSATGEKVAVVDV